MLFDVGSRAGFYDRKSPKMMLLEWCQKQKQPSPKYKATQQGGEGGAGGGLWTCRVILPDPKGHSDNDVIIKLSDTELAPDQQEAEQRAAVAALSRVQGDRALERVLPQQYVSQWNTRNQEAKESEEKNKLRAARDERNKEMEARKRHRDLERGPQVVVMSEHHRRAVE